MTNSVKPGFIYEPVVNRSISVVLNTVLLISKIIPVVNISAVVISGTVPVGITKPVVTSGTLVVKKSRSNGVVASAVVKSNAMVCVGSAENDPTVRSIFFQIMEK